MIILWECCYFHVKVWDLITGPCPNFNRGLAKSSYRYRSLVGIDKVSYITES